MAREFVPASDDKPRPWALGRDGDVPLTDLRELALIVAYHQPELLAEAAREWGSESA